MLTKNKELQIKLKKSAFEYEMVFQNTIRIAFPKEKDCWVFIAEILSKIELLTIYINGFQIHNISDFHVYKVKGLKFDASLN